MPETRFNCSGTPLESLCYSMIMKNGWVRKRKNKELGNQQPSSEQEKAQRLSEKSRDKCLEMGGPVKVKI